ncbi:hypothetical protein [Bacillus thuringiensis]|uniref:DUF1963 domain-containing protein n=1 Tax=Bacillus thuringiensis serovar toumanoffi TaxID=180862 RepID=A0ABD5I1U2_BACTU|nr:hypothetical protein [Bacillus thuringiensis]EEM95706.1 hypothetical protein bthur0013_28750 [Bacillus thuringiensis IBL 200]MCR6780949.1 hypothetical protein [Bacillus thuringiensis]MCR6859019.1 hypothetical protein [Bacillus thuringiensis]MCR6865763.1 hypothetical protein [Bacillus thuringiensis]MDW9211028.1 hypothetical protein [Bacillus thuringiensis serovar toumanoffi]
MTTELYGAHCKERKGYRVIEGRGSYNHYFGGQDCNLPVCKLCGEKMHQILCFDLKDGRLAELKSNELNILPFVSCLNCAMVWEPQYFELSDGGKTVQIIQQQNIEEWVMEEEYKLPVSLPKTPVKLINMKNDDIPTDEDSYWEAFDLFGSEYVCRLLGAPLYDNLPKDLACPTCAKEMKYVATITQDIEERGLISVVDFQFGEMNIYYYLCIDCSIIKTEIQNT